jgi:hypothetical protein
VVSGHHIGKGPNAFAFAFPKKEKAFAFAFPKKEKLVNSFS